MSRSSEHDKDKKIERLEVQNRELSSRLYNLERKLAILTIHVDRCFGTTDHCIGRLTELYALDHPD